MTHLTRAEFLRLTLGAFAFPRPPEGRHYVQPAAGGGRGEQVARLIQEYEAQGFHRTATEVDNQSARWLADVATRAGADVQLEAFSLKRVDVGSAFVEADGHRAEGVPFFDGSFTTPEGFLGRLNTNIVLTSIDTAGISTEGQSLATLRRSTIHRAIVAVTNGAHPGLSVSNAIAFTSPYGLPVLQVPSEEQRWLTEGAAAGREMRFVVDARRTPAQAFNVVASIRGSNRALDPVVVMTPRSGWWHCAAERGGGLACWVEAIRAVAAAGPKRSLIAIATSGHELGHLGLDEYLAKQAGLIKRATWIHLGANIGAARGVPRLQASDDEIEKMADAALSRAGAEVRQRVPRGTRPGGEARNIHDGGGRYVSLLGNGPYFHNVADRWPVAVDAAAVIRFSEAFGNLAVSLANM